MMLKNLLIVATTVCTLLFTFGIYRLFKDVEPNLCQMTYMFKSPQFTRIPLKKNVYGLYYYNEGDSVPLKTEKKFDLPLNGAPVLFVPGNGGSYKQVRSLGSVALQMGMGYNKPHLDYFTIDFNEELTALYGGYLRRQQRFLKQAIKTVLKLYKIKDQDEQRKIVLVGHSMGGVVIKSLLNESDWLKKIAIVVFIATPLDQPVIYADKQIDNFYQQTNQLLPENLTTECLDIDFTKNTTKVPDVLLISIGGGSRDKLVPAFLTESRLSDVHVLATAIPNVWVTCDHLAAMWCLQLMKVINKFLYALTFHTNDGYTLFNTNAVLNLQTAQHYFTGAQINAAFNRKITDFEVKNWTTTEELNFYKIFEHGLETEYRQAVLFDNVAPNEHIYIAVTHEAQREPWLFGCQGNNCSENRMLTQQIKQFPSKRGHRSYVLLNLAALLGTFSGWTHLLIRLSDTKHYADLYIDIHNADERLTAFEAPHWFQFMPKPLNLSDSTDYSSIKHMIRTLQFSNLRDEFFTFELEFNFGVYEPGHQRNYETTIKMYAPWAPGFERYFTFTAASGYSHKAFIHLPKFSPEAYKAPIFVDIHTDPWCVVNVNYRFALMETLQHMVQQYYHWLPAHMALIVISSLGCEFPRTFSSKKYADFLQLKSWTFVLVAHLANSALIKMVFLPQELREDTIKPFSTNASFIMHGFAVACCIVVALCIRCQLHLLGKLNSKFGTPSVKKRNIHLIFAILTAGLSIACPKCVILAIMLFAYIILVGTANKDNKAEATSAVEKQNEHEENDVAEKMDEPEQVNPDESSVENPTAKSGFQNLSFHVDLMVLLFLLLFINLGDAVVWFKSIAEKTPDYTVLALPASLLGPVTLSLCCVPLLWHLKAPSDVERTPVYGIVFNTIAALSLLLCAEKIFRLNYVIAFVFALLVFRELLNKYLRLRK